MPPPPTRKALSSGAYRAFVSSTFKDLREHRVHVIDALRKAGLDVEAMEEFSASSKSPRDFCSDRMARCNVCILIVGFRRGDCPPGEVLSFTQIEYEKARELGIEVLGFVLSEDAGTVAAWNPDFDERVRDPEINAWRGALLRRHVVREFGASPASLPIESAIASWAVEIESTRAGRLNLRRTLLACVAGAGTVLLVFAALAWFILRSASLRSLCLSWFLSYHDPLVYNGSANGRYDEAAAIVDMPERPGEKKTPATGTRPEIARAIDSYASLRAETRLSNDVQETRQSIDLLVNNAQYIRHEQKENFLNIIRHGGKVRILLWDYSNLNGNQTRYDEFCRAIGQAPEETRAGAENVHREFMDWQATIASHKADYPGTFEFRWNARPLFYTMWIRDWGVPANTLGQVSAHFYRGQEYFPAFRLSRKDGERMLINMQAEFKKAWDDGRELPPPRAPTQSHEQR